MEEWWRKAYRLKNEVIEKYLSREYSSILMVVSDFTRAEMQLIKISRESQLSSRLNLLTHTTHFYWSDEGKLYTHEFSKKCDTEEFFRDVARWESINIYTSLSEAHKYIDRVKLAISLASS